MSAEPADRPRKRARESEEPPKATSVVGKGYGNGSGYGSYGASTTPTVANGTSASGPDASTPSTTAEPGPASVAEPPREAQQTHVPNAARVNGNVPITKDTLEASFFLLEPHDEFTREVGDWIWTWCNSRNDVEIEAKIGLLVDNRPGLPPKTRVSFPLATESILTDASFARFESNMSLRQHHHFNQILNMRVQEAATPGYIGALVRYAHTKEIDTFYAHAGAQGKDRTKIRVTRDEKTGQVKAGGKACIEKSRVADMNIYSPKRGFDFRISISVEQPVPMPTTKASHQRWKNRVSYQHQAVTIDLTQVKGGDGKEVLHELEIEFSDMPLLIHEGQKNARGEDSLYYDLIQVFLNNIRMLIRNGVPP